MGPLLDAGGVSSMGPALMFSIQWVKFFFIGGSILRVVFLDCRAQP